MKRKNKWFIIYLQAERLEDTQNMNLQEIKRKLSVGFLWKSLRLPMLIKTNGSGSIPEPA